MFEPQKLLYASMLMNALIQPREISNKKNVCKRKGLPGKKFAKRKSRQKMARMSKRKNR